MGGGLEEPGPGDIPGPGAPAAGRSTYQFGLAGITFQIDSSVPLQGLANERFAAFRKESSGSQVKVFYIEVAASQKRKGTVPLSLQSSIRSHFKISGHILANPLLNSDPVLNELASVADHLELIALDSNQSSLSLFDFSLQQLKIFFFEDMSPFTRDSRMGPYSLAPFFVPFAGAMVHSSALVRRERAAVFLSPDEGGKTTSVRLAPAGVVLSDDQNVLREMDGGLVVHGTPWGHFFSNRCAPIGAFFVLHKAETFSLQPEDKNRLFDYLWNEHLGYHYFLPRKISAAHFDFLFRVSRRVPAFRLGFSKDFIDWRAVDRAMS